MNNSTKEVECQPGEVCVTLSYRKYDLYTKKHDIQHYFGVCSLPEMCHTAKKDYEALANDVNGVSEVKVSNKN